MAHILVVSDSEPVEVQAKADFVVPSSDSAALVAALDTVRGGNPDEGGVAWMVGDFILSANLLVSGVELRGLSKERFRVDCQGFAFSVDTITDVTVFQSSDTNAAVGVWQRIERARISQDGNAAGIELGPDTTVRDVEGSSFGGFFIDTSPDHVVIDGVHCTTGQGIRINKGTTQGIAPNVHLSNISLDRRSGTPGTGIHVIGDGTLGDGVGVTGRNIFISQHNVGIHLDTVGMVDIQATIITPVSHGWVLEDAYDCKISGIVFDPGAGADGVNVSGGSNCQIRDMIIRPDTSQQARYGINITSGTAHIVVGNDLGPAADYSSGALNDSGTNTRLTYPGDMTIGDNFVS